MARVSLLEGTHLRAAIDIAQARLCTAELLGMSQAGQLRNLINAENVVQLNEGKL